jgi:predicted ATP-dependent endonuclease of OLD family
MKIKQIHIRNFRSLADVTLPLEDTTVLIGENNVGKSVVLDALRFLLSRSATRQASFDEYDFHLIEDEHASPKEVEGITLEALFEESQPDEWPDGRYGETPPFPDDLPLDAVVKVGEFVDEKAELKAEREKQCAEGLMENS